MKGYVMLQLVDMDATIAELEGIFSNVDHVMAVTGKHYDANPEAFEQIRELHGQILGRLSRLMSEFDVLRRNGETGEKKGEKPETYAKAIKKLQRFIEG
jgi:hypothetical protein